MLKPSKLSSSRFPALPLPIENSLSCKGKYWQNSVVRSRHLLGDTLLAQLPMAIATTLTLLFKVRRHQNKMRQRVRIKRVTECPSFHLPRWWTHSVYWVLIGKQSDSFHWLIIERLISRSSAAAGEGNIANCCQCSQMKTTLIPTNKVAGGSLKDRQMQANCLHVHTYIVREEKHPLEDQQDSPESVPVLLLQQSVHLSCAHFAIWRRLRFFGATSAQIEPRSAAVKASVAHSREERPDILEWRWLKGALGINYTNYWGWLTNCTVCLCLRVWCIGE